MNELAGQNLGGYYLEEEVGRGSMGVVYRSKQLTLEREVAVKVLPPSLARDSSYVARFIREAQIIAGLNHPNIVHIYDAGQQNQWLYFAMEFVQGPTLANILHQDGMIPQYRAAEYAAQIADALDVAYKERHVIHRDIKPENLMLNRWGKVKVMDFGLARASGLQSITVAQTLVGSIYYSSPEQIWGLQLDNRSDIYALGVVLYEMVCGERPFTSRAMPELTQAITHGDFSPPHNHNPELSPALEQIIITALATERNQRFTTAGMMAEELRALQLKSPFQPSLSRSGRSWERVVVHPPKRPSAKRPQYLDPENNDIDLTNTQTFTPPDTENADTQLMPKQEHTAQNSVEQYPPEAQHSPQQPERKGKNSNTIPSMITTHHPALKQRRIWRKLRRIFTRAPHLS
ncbi:MAG TPA: protein kinase [Dictyobacter sp.]|jgi:serine/threonine-protein kinase|nr:protein kinase [Dictyobacter sp.]